MGEFVKILQRGLIKMNKIDKIVLKETRYVLNVTIILCVLLQAVFLVTGKWNYTHLFGTLLGGAAAVGNFLLMGITVQKAVEKDEQDAKKLVKSSQSARFAMLVVVAVFGYVIPVSNTIALIIPYLFPRVAVALRPFIIKD